MPIEMRHEFTADERSRYPRALFADSLPVDGDFEAVKIAATPMLRPLAEHIKRGGMVFWPNVGFGSTPEIRDWYNRCFMRLLELDVIARRDNVAAQKEKR